MPVVGVVIVVAVALSLNVKVVERNAIEVGVDILQLTLGLHDEISPNLEGLYDKHNAVDVLRQDDRICDCCDRWGIENNDIKKTV